MSKTRAPRKIDNPELKRVIDDVYKELNSIKDSIGTVYNGAPSESQGKVGDIAVYKDQFNKHILSIKTNNGWARIGMSIPKVLGEPFKGVGVDRDSINLESSDAINLKSKSSYKPQITIENQKADGLPPYLTFKKTNASDDNYIGAIGFNSVNDASQDVTYASILGQMTDVTDGTEDGKVTITTLKDGAVKNLTITGGDVTLPNDLTITGDLTVNGNNINFDASHSSIAVATRTGTDEGGYRATLDAGQGTGTAEGGSVYLRTSLAGGSSNDTANTVVTLLGANGNGNVGIRDGSKFNLDGEGGAGDTYLVQSSADILDIYTGGDLAIRLDENTGYVDIAGDWTLRNGWHGSKTKIKFYPHQFVESEDTAGRQFAVIEEDVSGKIGARVTNTSAVLYGFFPIPSGFKATHVRCYADTGSDLAIDTFQHDIDDGDIGSSLGSGDASAEVDITDLNSTSTNSLLIKLTFSNTSTEFYGGYITIATI